ncbi:hypothetical protein LX36DRAFT_714789 [Colletotrichum falcatum]|nr:hypothetical protein LX36DRAFT_714789 [Colletotrichum falcatum]
MARSKASCLPPLRGKRHIDTGSLGPSHPQRGAPPSGTPPGSPAKKKEKLYPRPGRERMRSPFDRQPVHAGERRRLDARMPPRVSRRPTDRLRRSLDGFAIPASSFLRREHRAGVRGRGASRRSTTTAAGLCVGEAVCEGLSCERCRRRLRGRDAAAAARWILSRSASGARAHLGLAVLRHEPAARVWAGGAEGRAGEDAARNPEGVQVCANDTLYSDGVCYAMALRGSGAKVRVEVVGAWPHRFWLRAVEAEGEMLEGLRWVLEG